MFEDISQEMFKGIAGKIKTVSKLFTVEISIRILGRLLEKKNCEAISKEITEGMTTELTKAIS